MRLGNKKDENSIGSCAKENFNSMPITRKRRERERRGPRLWAAVLERKFLITQCSPTLSHLATSFRQHKDKTPPYFLTFSTKFLTFFATVQNFMISRG